MDQPLGFEQRGIGGVGFEVGDSDDIVLATPGEGLQMLGLGGDGRDGRAKRTENVLALREAEGDR